MWAYLAAEPVFSKLPVIWGSMGLSLDVNDQGPRRSGFSASRLPSSCSMAFSEKEPAFDRCKRHTSSLTNKGYKTSDVEAVKVNAENKTQGWFCHVVRVSELRPERVRGRDPHTPSPIAFQSDNHYRREGLLSTCTYPLFWAFHTQTSYPRNWEREASVPCLGSHSEYGQLGPGSRARALSVPLTGLPPPSRGLGSLFCTWVGSEMAASPPLCFYFRELGTSGILSVFCLHDHRSAWASIFFLPFEHRSSCVPG